MKFYYVEYIDSTDDAFGGSSSWLSSDYVSEHYLYLYEKLEGFRVEEVTEEEFDKAVAELEE